jgi:hypothetical protein
VHAQDRFWELRSQARIAARVERFPRPGWPVAWIRRRGDEDALIARKVNEPSRPVRD